MEISPQAKLQSKPIGGCGCKGQIRGLLLGIDHPGWVATARVSDAARPETSSEPRTHHWRCVKVHAWDRSWTGRVQCLALVVEAAQGIVEGLLLPFCPPWCQRSLSRKVQVHLRNEGRLLHQSSLFDNNRAAWRISGNLNLLIRSYISESWGPDTVDVHWWAMPTHKWERATHQLANVLLEINISFPSI